MRNLWKFILALAPCAFVAAVGSSVTGPAIPTWYASLNKPSFSPPNWIFAPVWSVLFFFMGVSWYLVWTSGKGERTKYTAAEYFFLQLGFNVLWSLLFFGFHWPIGAFIDIVLLWVAIFLTIKHFFPMSNLAGYLLIPYLLWVSFAAILNISIVLLN